MAHPASAECSYKLRIESEFKSEVDHVANESPANTDSELTAGCLNRHLGDSHTPTGNEEIYWKATSPSIAATKIDLELTNQRTSKKVVEEMQNSVIAGNATPSTKKSDQTFHTCFLKEVRTPLYEEPDDMEGASPAGKSSESPCITTPEWTGGVTRDAAQLERPGIKSVVPSTGESSSSSAPISRTQLPPQRTSDLFHGSREFAISGSEFNSVAGNMTHRTEQAFYFPAHAVSSASNTVTTSTPPQTIEPVATEETDSEKYARLLWPKGRGYPLWCPNPNKNLSPEYVESGVRIGDVGIITTHGDFDFLFNICLAADHPINGNRVPEGFIPVSKPDPVDVNSDTEQFPGAFLMSKSIQGKTGTRTTPPLGVDGDYYFQCSHYEGAILILPEGSFREDLRNLNVFRQYAIQNGESWYRYANGPRGREAVNGSIHLVTGYDKGTSWVLGAFAHRTASATGITDLQFSATTVNDTRSEQTYTYHWNQSGPARIKYGPTPVPTVMNQCLFARTFLIELNTSLWTMLFGKGITVQVMPNTSMKSQNVTSKSSYIPFGIGNFSFFSGSQRSGKGASEKDQISAQEDAMDVNAISTFNNISNIMHPTQKITRYLLNKVPTASVAIAHHDDWKWLISDSSAEAEESIPEPDELTRRLDQLTLTELNADSTLGVFLTAKGSETEEEQRTSKAEQKQKETPPEADTFMDAYPTFDHYLNLDLSYSPIPDYLNPYAMEWEPPSPPANLYDENYNPFSGRSRRSSLRRSASASSMNSVLSDNNGRSRIERDFAEDRDHDRNDIQSPEMSKIRKQRIESEQQRRDEIRDGYMKLKDVLPPSTQKSSKVSILGRASNRIVSLEEEIKRQQQRLKELEEQLGIERKLRDEFT